MVKNIINSSRPHEIMVLSTLKCYIVLCIIELYSYTIIIHNKLLCFLYAKLKFIIKKKLNQVPTVKIYYFFYTEIIFDRRYFHTI